MNKKFLIPISKLLTLLTIGLLCLPTYAKAESAASTTLNAGFASGFRYSTNPLFAETKVIRIYFTLQNQSPADIFGVVRVFDNDQAIGDVPFSVVGERLIEQWIDWSVTPGTHAIRAVILNPKKSDIGQPPSSIALRAASSDIDVQTVPTTPIISKTPASSLATITDDSPGLQNTELLKNSSPTTSLTTKTTAAAAAVSSLLGQAVEQLLDLVRNSLGSSATEPTATSSSGEPPSNPAANLPTVTETKSGLGNQFERFIASLTAGLESKNQSIKSDLQNGQPSDPILTETINALADKTFIKIPENKKPTKQLVYSWLISLTILILNTWWLMAIIFLVILRALWKLWKLVRGHDDD